MKRFLISIALIASFVLAGFAYDDHSYASLQEKEFKYRDWTYKNVLDDANINLREFGGEKKLILVLYYAPWCHNSNYQLPFVKRLHEKYKDFGFSVIGVSNYAAKFSVTDHIELRKVNFPVVMESASSTERKKTLHYKYRKMIGDDRKWGTPWNLFLEPQGFEKRGSILTKKASYVNGELIEDEIEEFVRRKLGLPAKEAEETEEKREQEGEA